MKFLENFVDTLAGNNVMRAHSISKEFFEFGTNSIWEVYRGVSRASNRVNIDLKQEVSVFVLNKRKLGHLEPTRRTRLLEIYANGVRAMEATKHENILKIISPISESKFFVFYTGIFLHLLPNQFLIL